MRAVEISQHPGDVRQGSAGVRRRRRHKQTRDWRRRAFRPGATWHLNVDPDSVNVEQIKKQIRPRVIRLHPAELQQLATAKFRQFADRAGSGPTSWSSSEARRRTFNLSPASRHPPLAADDGDLIQRSEAGMSDRTYFEIFTTRRRNDAPGDQCRTSRCASNRSRGLRRAPREVARRSGQHRRTGSGLAALRPTPVDSPVPLGRRRRPVQAPARRYANARNADLRNGSASTASAGACPATPGAPGARSGGAAKAPQVLRVGDADDAVGVQEIHWLMPECRREPAVVAPRRAGCGAKQRRRRRRSDGDDDGGDGDEGAADQ